MPFPFGVRFALPFGVLLALACCCAAPLHAQALLHTLTSPDPEPNAGFGALVAAVGDVDGDGFGDLLVGAPGADPGTSPDGAGRAYVFSGATGTLIHELTSPNEEENGTFGIAVAGVPDLDSDEVPDLLVGAYTEDGKPQVLEYGRAHVFSGATGVHLHTLASPNEEEGGRFGDAVAGVPDVDGDGHGDLLVGARYEDVGSLTSAGRAYVFSGATGALLHEFESPNAEAFGFFGSAVAGTADLDGDGRGDLLIGAQGEAVIDGLGRTYVFSGATGALLHTLTGMGGFFGRAVAAVPDTDGDGVPDLLVGAHRETIDPHADGDTAQGRAYLFSGATGVLHYTVVAPLPVNSGEFGWAVSGVPDLDGDERGDLVIGTHEQDDRVFVFSGATGRNLFALPALTSGDFGWTLTGAEDLDGDGRGDLLIGTLSAEEAYAYSGAPGPVALSATALTGTVTQGGRLRVQVSGTNPGPAILFGDLRIRANGPGGVSGSAVLARDLRLPADVTATRAFRVRVPVGAPVGVYQATVEALAGGVAVAGSASFSFIVTEGAAREDGAGEDAVLTWDAPMSDAAAVRAAVTPNPASGEATVAFVLDAPSEVRVTLYDVLGRAVHTVDAGHLGAGPHRLALDASGLPTGVYVWRLTTGAAVQTGHLTVAR